MGAVPGILGAQRALHHFVVLFVWWSARTPQGGPARRSWKSEGLQRGGVTRNGGTRGSSSYGASARMVARGAAGLEVLVHVYGGHGLYVRRRGGRCRLRAGGHALLRAAGASSSWRARFASGSGGIFELEGTFSIATSSWGHVVNINLGASVEGVPLWVELVVHSVRVLLRRRSGWFPMAVGVLSTLLWWRCLSPSSSGEAIPGTRLCRGLQQCRVMREGPRP